MKVYGNYLDSELGTVDIFSTAPYPGAKYVAEIEKMPLRFSDLKWQLVKTFGDLKVGDFIKYRFYKNPMEWEDHNEKIVKVTKLMTDLGEDIKIELSNNKEYQLPVEDCRGYNNQAAFWLVSEDFPRDFNCTKE